MVCDMSAGEQVDADLSRAGRCFMPARASVKERWKRIDRAFHRGEALPPVSLYEVGGLYFVLDGYHRVSVARYHGVEWIDADVTEFRVLVRGKEEPTDPTSVAASAKGGRIG